MTAWLRVRGNDHVVDAARASAFTHEHVPFGPPVWTPAILYDPVRLFRPAHGREAARAVADDEDAMVERFRVANVRASDATHVRLHPCSIDTDRKRTVFHQCGSYLVFVRRDERKVLERRAELALFRLALAFFAYIRVGFLGVDATVFDDIFHRIRRQTTVTARIARLWHIWIASNVAIHQLLLAELDQLARFEKVRAFERPRRGKRPATPALPLILHARHRTLKPPIKLFRQTIRR
mmetsp:Transcript_6774/g.22700  ORF Transcript_6774/g.22700 Transcript_6774/m.22700 type:complete len:237 (+) Transcript_6774:516-1226(+)